MIRFGKGLIVALVAGSAVALAMGPAWASQEATSTSGGTKASAPAAGKHEMYRVRGDVTAVDPTAKTMAVKVMRHGQEQTVNVDVTDKTVIHHGKARESLADIKVGDRVWMKYEGAGDKQTAEAIHILKTHRVAAKQ